MISSTVLSVLFAILSLSVNVNSQACSNAVQYSACSSNTGCGCLSYSFSNTTGVCGLTTESCSLFAPCQSPNDACLQSGHICVRHSRCSSNPICLPPTSYDQNACPQIITSNYSNALTVNSANFTRPGKAGTFYYHAIEVRVPVTGTYTFRTSSTNADTFGYIYQGNFYPTYPQYNMVAQNDDGPGGGRNFGFTVTLRSDVTYILVFTTYAALGTGTFNISVTGPSSVSMNPISV